MSTDCLRILHEAKVIHETLGKFIRLLEADKVNLVQIPGLASGECQKLLVIRQVVASFYGFKEMKLCRRGRTADVAWARQVGMFFMREMTNASMECVGNYFGNRDHGTVLNAVRVVQADISLDTSLGRQRKSDVENLRAHFLELFGSVKESPVPIRQGCGGPG